MRTPQRVEVSITADPDGNPAILLQLPNGWITMHTAEDARVLAVVLNEVADEFDQAIKPSSIHHISVPPKESP